CFINQEKFPQSISPSLGFQRQHKPQKYPSRTEVYDQRIKLDVTCPVHQSQQQISDESGSRRHTTSPETTNLRVLLADKLPSSPGQLGLTS
uniref:Uncharacterized protein n=1 Tax=Anser cygnoides TaxID=8845 RepID=A0A8B9IQK5_ANSCY